MSIDFDDFNIESFKQSQSHTQQRFQLANQDDWFQQDTFQPISNRTQQKGKQKQIPLFPLNLDDEVEIDIKSSYPHVNIIKKEQIKSLDQKSYILQKELQIDQIFKKYQPKRFTQSKNKQLDQIKTFNLKCQKMQKAESDLQQSNQQDNSFPSQVHSLLKQDSQSVIQSRKISIKAISLFVAIHIAQLIYLILGKLIFYEPKIKLFDQQELESMSLSTFAVMIILVWILFHTFLLANSTLYSAGQFFGKNLQNALSKKIFNENSMILVTKNSILLSMAVTLSRLVFLNYVGFVLSFVSIFIDLNMLKQLKKVVWQRTQFQKNIRRHSQNQLNQREENINMQANELMRDQVDL